MTKPKSIEKEAILRYSFLSKEVFLCKILQKYICILYKKKNQRIIWTLSTKRHCKY